MYIVLGGTGHVGSAVVQTLLEHGQDVIIVSRNADKAGGWKQKGANVESVDVLDTDALQKVFEQGKRLFLLNPPADPSKDTEKEERRSLSSILIAMKNTPLEKVVALSTYGAQPGEMIGDLGVLYEMEQALAKLDIPSTIIRGAYYMSNWSMSLASAQHDGKIYSFYPPDFQLPMVAPQDIGLIAAKLLIESNSKGNLQYVEGPARYSPADVAEAFAKALKRPVEVVEIPREHWITTMKEVGFSEIASKSMAGMTAITRDVGSEMPPYPLRGATTLLQYIEDLVKSI
ncbi:NmrA family NAD(P)-binding protein [Chryseosolibacter indicus]|uniref:NmrA family NAD(P)-binding protein n=1 Tax=Chryseosolibacter indicus TaxID=2782351 RepID=A0ABS5VZ80_9BACT|nr:NmrA family NAD(P)-binding protein [Chryseosolibacter indicus]MBT1706069.1 NmrA family NAD(P)-binding protein [Chryseosolibacter indicus]